MTEIDVARLREIAAGATPGPWAVTRSTRDDDWLFEAPSQMDPGRQEALIYPCGYDGEIGIDENDAAFISTFDPSTVIDLLDRLERAEGAVERVRAVARRGDVRRVSDPEEACLYLEDVTEALDGDA